MRIGFPNGSRADERIARDEVRIGSAADNDIVLDATQAAGHHLSIVRDRCGLVLTVMPGAARIYVNARPVRERALLRLGDGLSIGTQRLLLKAESDAIDTPADEPIGASPAVAVLRAVAGPGYGRLMSVAHTLEIDARGRVAVVNESGPRLRFWCAENALYLQAPADPKAGDVAVNGITIERARLRIGDQVVWGAHRLLVENMGGEGFTSKPGSSDFQPPEKPPVTMDAGPRGEMWWLIATAAVLALGIALLLLARL